MSSTAPTALHRRVLRVVAGGADTAERLIATGMQPADALTALTELELAGALSRGEGGRYVVCEPRAQGHSARAYNPASRGCSSVG